VNARNGPKNKEGGEDAVCSASRSFDPTDEADSKQAEPDSKVMASSTEGEMTTLLHRIDLPWRRPRLPKDR